MDRKGIIAVVIAIIVIAIWQVNYTRQLDRYHQAQEAQKAIEAAAAKEKAKAVAPEETVSAAPPADGKEPVQPAGAPAEPAAPAVAEALEKAPSPSVEYTFTNLGGGITRAVLLKHVAEHGGQQSGDRETDVTLNEFGDAPIGAIIEGVAITAITSGNPAIVTTAAAHGLTSGMTVNISGVTGCTPAISGAYTITALTSTTFSIPVDCTAPSAANTGSIYPFSLFWRTPFTSAVNAQTGEATFERTDARQLQTTKKFTVPKSSDLRGEYLVGLDVTFANRGSQEIKIGSYYVHTGSAGPIHALDQALYTGFDWYNGTNVFKAVSAFSSGGFLGYGRTEVSVVSQAVEKLDWAAVTNQYFCTIVTPTASKGSAIWTRKLGVNDLPASDQRVIAASGAGKVNMQAVEGALGMPGFTLAAGASLSQHFEIYAGPREYARLKTLGAGQQEIMDFGTFKLVSEALLNSLNWLKGLLGSYAAAIIVLTLIIRSAMWPLQNKSTESMKKMQALSPEMTKLKEKYQDDPTRMNQEMMKLYKDYGVNPLSGCLPMVVQIPIFFGLFRMLGKAVELRNSHFLWVHDLSQPDTVAMLLGKPINILPLCMAVTMFVQMKLSPKSGDAAQQKIFMFMPLIFVFFCYNYASALALYWTVQNLFSIGQLYVTRNKLTPSLQRIAGAGKKKGRA